MKDESIEPGSPTWLEQLADDAEVSQAFTVKSLLNDGWHSGDIGIFYVRYAYDKQLRELINFCDNHKLRFEISCKDNANTFRLIVCRTAAYENLMKTGQFSDDSENRMI